MGNFIQDLGKLLTLLTLKRIGLLTLLVIISLSGFAGYHIITAYKATTEPQLQEIQPAAIEITRESSRVLDEFMVKYPSVAYVSVLKLNFARNIRTPVYHGFNDKQLEATIRERMNGGDGSVPIFLRDDRTNNNQMIKIIHGSLTCSPFSDGGIGRVWPDLSSRLAISCRVTIPPAYSLARGYVVIHLAKELRPFEMESLEIDLYHLAQKLDEIDSRGRAVSDDVIRYRRSDGITPHAHR